MDKHGHTPCSDDALRAKTGRDWSDWCSLLDAKGAMDLEHTSLARLVGSFHNAGDWWSQTVAVGYERLRGKRILHERSDRTFSASISRTLPISALDAHGFFTVEEKRTRWLGREVAIRAATAPKSVRIQWSDGTLVSVWITGKEEVKCRVAVEHSKLDCPAAVAAAKEFWKLAFQRLAKLAE